MVTQELTPVQKKQIRSASIYTMALLVILAYGAFYLLDSYSALFSQGSEIQSVHTQYEATKKDGVPVDSLKEVLQRVLKDKKQSDSYFSDKDKLAEAIKKPSSITASYDEWLMTEAWKESALDAEVRRNNDIIGNIIPTFAQQNIASANLKEVDNLVNFRTFVQYVEYNLLKKYQLESYSSIGLSNITFDKDDTKQGNIGSFKVTLDLKGVNTNIKSFLTAVQNSGKLTIQDGKLVSPTTLQWDGKYSGLGNLLIKVDSASFDTTLENDAAFNKGIVTLRFYVRGVGSQEFVLLRSGLMAKYKDIQKSIAAYSDCKKLLKVVCADTEWSRSVGAIRSLQRDIGALKDAMESLKSANPNKDVSSELDKALSFNASLRVIERNLQDNVTVITNLSKVWVK